MGLLVGICLIKHKKNFYIGLWSNTKDTLKNLDIIESTSNTSLDMLDTSPKKDRKPKTRLQECRLFTFTCAKWLSAHISSIYKRLRLSHT